MLCSVFQHLGTSLLSASKQHWTAVTSAVPHDATALAERRGFVVKLHHLGFVADQVFMGPTLPASIIRGWMALLPHARSISRPKRDASTSHARDKFGLRRKPRPRVRLWGMKLITHLHLVSWSCTPLSHASSLRCLLHVTVQ